MLNAGVQRDRLDPRRNAAADKESRSIGDADDAQRQRNVGRALRIVFAANVLSARHFANQKLEQLRRPDGSIAAPHAKQFDVVAQLVVHLTWRKPATLSSGKE